ncbi:MAG: hypothetical protein DMF06_05110 [Verrucomicrobia bacterium]|nr:MAG: hypothetical protein DMF06_05110 [Verrucomicrobiota bacterium]
MMADKLAELRAASSAAHKAQKDAETARDREIYEAKQRIVEAHASNIYALQKAKWEADEALRQYQSETASHPWEGKRVNHKWKSSGGRVSPPVAGVVEVRRVGTEFPGNTAKWRIPDMGKPFVRMLKKDGSPSLKFEAFGTGDNWVLAEGESE